MYGTRYRTTKTQMIQEHLTNLVGGFNPFEKYCIVKIGIFPKKGWKLKKLKPQPRNPIV